MRTVGEHGTQCRGTRALTGWVATPLACSLHCGPRPLSRPGTRNALRAAATKPPWYMAGPNLGSTPECIPTCGGRAPVREHA